MYIIFDYICKRFISLQLYMLYLPTPVYVTFVKFVYVIFTYICPLYIFLHFYTLYLFTFVYVTIANICIRYICLYMNTL